MDRPPTRWALAPSWYVWDRDAGHQHRAGSVECPGRPGWVRYALACGQDLARPGIVQALNGSRLRGPVCPRCRAELRRLRAEMGGSHGPRR